MRIVSKKWIFDNLNSSSNVNLAVSGTVKDIIKDIKKNKIGRASCRERV